MKTVITKSELETFELGVLFAKTLKKNSVVLLKGDMGAGKTAFTKGIAKGLGINEPITSPTYAYMNDYDGVLYHYDCYRLLSGEHAESLGLTDYFDAGGVCVIEWSENIKSVLPKDVIIVEIKILSQNERSITL